VQTSAHAVTLIIEQVQPKVKELCSDAKIPGHMLTNVIEAFPVAL